MPLHHGGCHCGAVRFEADLELEGLMTCNCSICGKTGAIMAFIPAEQMRQTAGHDCLTDYQFGQKAIHHSFCKVCGVRSFAQGFAQAMVSADPQHYVAVASKAQRKGRIFIDYLRNGRGATAIASYSLRARAGAPVAVPLAWPELTRVRGSNAYDWRSLPARLRQLRQDPWQEMATLRQDLSRWSGS